MRDFRMAHRPVCLALAVLLAGLAAGCRTLSQSEIKFLETRDMTLPYQEAYQAALNGMFSLGMQITHSDKQSGVISGQAGEYTNRRRYTSRRAKQSVRKVTLLLQPRGPRLTQLRMKVLIDEEPVIDRELMTAIWQRVEREALLDARR